MLDMILFLVASSTHNNLMTAITPLLDIRKMMKNNHDDFFAMISHDIPDYNAGPFHELLGSSIKGRLALMEQIIFELNYVAFCGRIDGDFAIIKLYTMYGQHTLSSYLIPEEIIFKWDNRVSNWAPKPIHWVRIDCWATFATSPFVHNAQEFVRFLEFFRDMFAVWNSDTSTRDYQRILEEIYTKDITFNDDRGFLNGTWLGRFVSRNIVGKRLLIQATSFTRRFYPQMIVTKLDMGGDFTGKICHCGWIEKTLYPTSGVPVVAADRMKFTRIDAHTFGIMEIESTREGLY